MTYDLNFGHFWAVILPSHEIFTQILYIFALLYEFYKVSKKKGILDIFPLFSIFRVKMLYFYLFFYSIFMKYLYFHPPENLKIEKVETVLP